MHVREGLVATPDNFGKLGARPKDSELLDALSTQFIADGWCGLQKPKCMLRARVATTQK